VAPRLKAIYDAAGLNLDTDIQRVVIAGPDQVQAFAAGKVDALFAHTPYLETALTAHDGFLVVEASHGEIATLADGEIHTLATSRDMAARNRGLIARAGAAIAAAERLIHSDPKATLRALSAYGAIHEPEPALARIAAIYGPAAPLKPGVSAAAIRHDAELYPAHPKAPDFGPGKVRAEDFILNLD
jgi:ABC-type nitrate/sulfonate/bicarbonate transport system substrate-binding protein